MDTFKEKGIEIHRSDECGDIVFTSTGNGLEVDCKKEVTTQVLTLNIIKLRTL